jgi:hypothetical protein
VALAGRRYDAATTGPFVGVGEAEGLAAVRVGVAEGLAAVRVGEATAVVGVAVLSTANLARGSWALPCPSGGRTVGGLEGTLVAVGVAVGSGGSGVAVGVRGGSTVGALGGASAGVSDGATVGEAEGLAAVRVGEATAVVGVAVLSTTNSARGNRALPCPGRG